MSAPFLWTLRVYYEDTDFSGLVYHASYLRFLERARTEFLRARGVTQNHLFEQGFAFVVRKMTLDYRVPAKMDDLLQVKTISQTMKGASFILSQSIWREQVCLLEADVTIAFIKNGRAARMPADLAAVLAA